MVGGGKKIQIIFFVSQISLLLSIQTCTAKKEDTMIYKNTVPATLRSGVTRVFLELSKEFDMESDVFSHRSWQYVTVLDITATFRDDHYRFSIENFTFRHLSSLEELRFHGNYIEYFGSNTFHQISHLAVLELSDCEKLQTKTLYRSLLNVNITIDKFKIINFASGIGQYLVLDEKFHEVIQKKQIKALSFRKSFLELTQTGTSFIPLKQLKNVDISQITLRSSKPMTDIVDQYVPFLESLTTLNASSIQKKYSVPNQGFLLDKIIKNCSELHNRLIEGFLKVENLYLNKLFNEIKETVIMNNTLFNISDCKFNLKRWHFRENKLRYINITAYLPLNNTLKELDFSDNEIEYVSPRVFQNTKSLEVLKLSNNNLYNMQTLSEFKDLLVSLKKLKRFHLAGNELSLLPQDIFRNNEHLQVLDLSENKLKTVAFTLKHMKSLQLLNLGGNHIKYLGDITLADFQRFYEEMTFKEENQTLVIEMIGNPFECSCESVPFMQWMIRNGISSEKYLCKIENEEREIDDDLLQDAKFLCHRTIIIVGTSSSIVFLSVVGVLVTIYVLRRKRRQTRECIRNAFLYDYLNGGLKEKYLCAISFASEDEMCALNTIYVEFTNALTKILGTRRDFICIGDKHFCLGRPIVNEIIRCTSESCVLIFVISESFCKSRWCELEIREAYENGKPIILILKEEVEESKMSTLLFRIFNKFTRAKLVEKDGVYTLNTEWENLGESVIKLASEAYAKK